MEATTDETKSPTRDISTITTTQRRVAIMRLRRILYETIVIDTKMSIAIEDSTIARTTLLVVMGLRWPTRLAAQATRKISFLMRATIVPNSCQIQQRRLSQWESLRQSRLTRTYQFPRQFLLLGKILVAITLRSVLFKACGWPG
jgi:hypothetical protein